MTVRTEAAVAAVFVDGVGRVRAHALPEIRADYAVPIYPPVGVVADEVAPPTTTDVGLAWFEWIGELPDRRHVYGFRFAAGPSFTLWRVSLSAAYRAELGADVEATVADLIARVGTPPRVTLYRADDEAGGLVVCGVARRAR